MVATKSKTRLDCKCHRLNTSIDSAWKKLVALDEKISCLNSFCHELVKYVNQAAGIQSNLPTIKHGRETRKLSLNAMFSSILESRDALVKKLRERKKENLISRINVDLLQVVVDFLEVFSSRFDMLKFADKPTLQNALPVYYTFYEQWQQKDKDTEKKL